MKNLYKLRFKIICKIIKFELHTIVKHRQIAEKLSAQIASLECGPMFKEMEERKKYL